MLRPGFQTLSESACCSIQTLGFLGVPTPDRTPVGNFRPQELTTQLKNLRFFPQSFILLLQQSNELGNITLATKARANVLTHLSGRRP